MLGTISPKSHVVSIRLLHLTRKSPSRQFRMQSELHATPGVGVGTGILSRLPALFSLAGLLLCFVRVSDSTARIQTLLSDGQWKLRYCSILVDTSARYATFPRGH